MRTLISAKKQYLDLEGNALARAKEWYAAVRETFGVNYVNTQYGWIIARGSLPDSIWGDGFFGNQEAASLLRERLLADGWNDVAIISDRVVEVRALVTPVVIATVGDGPTFSLAYAMEEKPRQAPAPEDVVSTVMTHGVWQYGEWTKSYFPPSAIHSLRFGPQRRDE
ncbi:MAG TPA: hypothetical protein VFR81_00985 [Longimicrobium sp.]|nr:hypothetical protein [Longimicrobium sp.]